MLDQMLLRETYIYNLPLNPLFWDITDGSFNSYNVRWTCMVIVLWNILISHHILLWFTQKTGREEITGEQPFNLSINWKRSTHLWR